MRNNGQSRKAAQLLKNFNFAERLKMPWRNETNKIDCGVFAMRHLETYKGDGLKNWKCGIKPNNLKQLRFMRAKYCAAILSADSNIRAVRNKAEASLFYRMLSQDGPISAEEFLLSQ